MPELSDIEKLFLEDQSYRLRIIKEIKGEENRQRMSSSLQDCDVYAKRLRPYVMQHLSARFNPSTVKETPVVSSVFTCTKTINAMSSLYRECPERDFTGIDNDDVKDSLHEIYSEIGLNSKLLESERFYNLQSRQNHVAIYPKGDKLKVRVLKAHQLNVVVNPSDSEEAEIYLISSFDKSLSNLKENSSNNYNELIGDADDYKLMAEQYVIWSKNLHFKMNAKGKILSESTENPIAPLCPIVEIAVDSKDFEYWIQGVESIKGNEFFGGSEISNFCIEFNSALSSLGLIVYMQGFAQAYLKAPENLQPAQITIGTNSILRLITSEGAGDVEFGYASPTTDLAGSLQYVQALLSQHLSSLGIDPKTVTGNADSSQSFSSGVEKLLSMISQFEASKETIAVYEQAEAELFEVVKAWCNASSRIDVGLSQAYQLRLPEESTISLVFKKPEAILSDGEKLDLIERKMEKGLMSKVDAIGELENKSRDEAKKRIEEIDEDDMSVKAEPIMPIIPPLMIEDKELEDDGNPEDQ